MKKIIKEWKKVLESDLPYIVNEIKEDVQIPAIIFLEGEVGAGKTTFCQYFSGKKMLSPTYSILSEGPNLLHADFYRIESPEEFVHLELNLYLEKKDYFLAEWGLKWLDQLLPLLPEQINYYLLKIDHIDQEMLDKKQVSATTASAEKSDHSDSGLQRHLKLYSINPLL